MARSAFQAESVVGPFIKNSQDAEPTAQFFEAQKEGSRMAEWKERDEVRASS